MIPNDDVLRTCWTRSTCFGAFSGRRRSRFSQWRNPSGPRTAVYVNLLLGQDFTLINRFSRSSYIQTPAYYAVAMPVSLSTAFLLKWDVVGLWVGVALALVIVAGLQIIVVYMTKWDKVVRDAYTRTVNVNVE